MAHKRPKDKGPDANYDFKAVDPKKRMGQGSFANMPERPIFMTFSDKPDYRDGLVNKFTDSVEQISDIYENEC